jgi:hypothetical protein
MPARLTILLVAQLQHQLVADLSVLRETKASLLDSLRENEVWE